MPYGITQCCLPPVRGDIPALTPAEAGTRFNPPEGCKAELNSFSSGVAMQLQTVILHLVYITLLSNQVNKPLGIQAIITRCLSQATINLKGCGRKGI